VNTVLINGDDSFSPFFVLRYFVSGVCFTLYVLFSLIGCAGSVGISLASRVMYIFRVCVSPLCGVPGRYKLIWAFPGAGGGAVQVFLFFGSVVAGMVRLKW
jgi:hypothetical protein